MALSKLKPYILSRFPLKSHGGLPRHTGRFLSNCFKTPRISDWVRSSFLSQSLHLRSLIRWLAWLQNYELPMDLGIWMNFAWTTGIRGREAIFQRKNWRVKQIIQQSQTKMSTLEPSAPVHLMLESLELGKWNSSLDPSPSFAITYLADGPRCFSSLHLRILVSKRQGLNLMLSPSSLPALKW